MKNMNELAEEVARGQIRAVKPLQLKAQKGAGDAWTIGYGMSAYPYGSRVQQDDTCTQQQAEEWLEIMVSRMRRLVETLARKRLSAEELANQTANAYLIGESEFRRSRREKKGAKKA